MERQAIKELFKMIKKNLLLLPMLWPDWKGSKLPASKSPIKRIKSTFDVGSIQPFWPGQCTGNNEELVKNFQLGRLWRYFETQILIPYYVTQNPNFVILNFICNLFFVRKINYICKMLIRKQKCLFLCWSSFHICLNLHVWCVNIL